MLILVVSLLALAIFTTHTYFTCREQFEKNGAEITADILFMIITVLASINTIDTYEKIFFLYLILILCFLNLSLLFYYHLKHKINFDALKIAKSIIIVVFVFLSGTTGYYFYQQGIMTPDTVISWKEPRLEEKVRSYRKIKFGEPVTIEDLRGITKMYILGSDIYFDDDEEIKNGLTLTHNVKSYTINKETFFTHGGIVDLKDIKFFKDLKKLYVVNNDIESINSISELTNLVEIKLSNNNITSLDFLPNNQTLNDIFINCNGSLTDITLLSNYKSLSTLGIVATGISDISPISELHNLTELVLSYNNMENLTALSNLVNLTTLNLNNTVIKNTENFANIFKNLNRIENFQMCKSGINSIDFLPEKSYIKKIVMNDNYIGDIAPIGKLSKLDVCSFNNNSIVDLSSLSKLNDSTSLYLDNNPITDWLPIDHVKNVVGRPQNSQNVEFDIKKPIALVFTETGKWIVNGVELSNITKCFYDKNNELWIPLRVLCEYFDYNIEIDDNQKYTIETETSASIVIDFNGNIIVKNELEYELDNILIYDDTMYVKKNFVETIMDLEMYTVGFQNETTRVIITNKFYRKPTFYLKRYDNEEHTLDVYVDSPYGLEWGRYNLDGGQDRALHEGENKIGILSDNDIVNISIIACDKNGVYSHYGESAFFGTILYIK